MLILLVPNSETLRKTKEIMFGILERNYQVTPEKNYWHYTRNHPTQAKNRIIHACEISNSEIALF